MRQTNSDFFVGIAMINLYEASLICKESPI